MAYLGKTPSQAVRSRYYFTATGGETSLSGTDDNGNTLTYTDGNYVDVSLNGVALVAGSDYNTTTANTIGGLTALTASDVVEIVVYDTFSVFSGAFTGDISLGDNVKAVFGAGSDLQIYHDGSNSFVVDNGTGGLQLRGSTFVALQGTNGENGVLVTENGSAQLRFNNSPKLETTGTGIDVTGDIAVSGNVDGRDVAADGSKLDGIASSADNYSSWTISDGSNSEAIGSGNTLTIAGGGDTTTSYSAASNTLTVTTNAPEAFPSGTSMLFQQTAAPTGWTKQTTHNDKALRIVTGTVGTGGSVAFSTALATPSVSGSVSISGAPSIGNLAGNATINGNPNVSGNINSHTLSVSQIPSHSHSGVFNPGTNNNNANRMGRGSGGDKSTDNTGGNGGHNHGHNFSGSKGNLGGNATINGAPGIGNLGGSLSSATSTINVNYVDFIIANKD